MPQLVDFVNDLFEILEIGGLMNKTESSCLRLFD
jgi:hypothetical protein